MKGGHITLGRKSKKRDAAEAGDDCPQRALLAAHQGGVSATGVGAALLRSGCATADVPRQMCCDHRRLGAGSLRALLALRDLQTEREREH